MNIMAVSLNNEYLVPRQGGSMSFLTSHKMKFMQIAVIVLVIIHKLLDMGVGSILKMWEEKLTSTAFNH